MKLEPLDLHPFPHHNRRMTTRLSIATLAICSFTVQRDLRPVVVESFDKHLRKK